MLMAGAKIIPLKSASSPAVQKNLPNFHFVFSYRMQMISGSRDSFIQTLCIHKISVPLRMLYCFLATKAHLLRLRSWKFFEGDKTL